MCIWNRDRHTISVVAVKSCNAAFNLLFLLSLADDEGEEGVIVLSIFYTYVPISLSIYLYLYIYIYILYLVYYFLLCFQYSINYKKKIYIYNNNFAILKKKNIFWHFVWHLHTCYTVVFFSHHLLSWPTGQISYITLLFSGVVCLVFIFKVKWWWPGRLFFA